MTRMPPAPRSRSSRFAGPLLIAGLLACAEGCAVEDPVAYILTPDSGTSPQFTDDEGPDGLWAPPPDEGVLPDCGRDASDAGVPCGDAGAAED
ncbi:hypothetical protein ACLESD_36675 [Pyxidicoccus sp. 3LFB2]